MKKVIFFSAIALWLFAAASCNKKEVEFDSISVSNLSYDGCKNNSQKSTVKEYLKLKAKGRYLKLEHINAEFNCCPDEIIVDSQISNDTIFINENETEPTCDCICKYDLNYTIGMLAYKKYHVVLSKLDYPYIKFDLDFNQNTDEIVNIEKKY